MEKCMQEIGTVHKQGWLTKSPPVTQLNSLRNWKKKYFVILQLNPDKESIFRNASQGKGNESEDFAMKHLHEFYLVYWDCESGKSKIGSQNLSAIPLLGHYHAHKYNLYEQKYSNVIILVTDNRVYFLTAEDEKEMESWHFHLNKTLSMVRRKEIAEKVERIETEKEKEAIPGDYIERVELPVPAPRESWTLPKRLSLDRQSGEKDSSVQQSREDSGCDSPPPYTLLSRCSYGSVHGYHSHEKTTSFERHYKTSNKTEHVDEKADSLYKKDDKEATTFVVSLEEEENANENEDQDDISKRAILNQTMIEQKLLPLSIFPPPPPKDFLLRLPPSPVQREEIKDVVVDIQNRKNQTPYEIYKFLKGPEVTTLTLFDCDVTLPKTSIANVTTEGLQIYYRDHEILIKRTRYLSDDIIEV